MFTWNYTNGEQHIIVLQQVIGVTTDSDSNSYYFYVQVVGTDQPIKVPYELYDLFKKELAAYLSRKEESTQKILDAINNVQETVYYH